MEIAGDAIASESLMPEEVGTRLAQIVRVEEKLSWRGRSGQSGQSGEEAAQHAAQLDAWEDEGGSQGQPLASVAGRARDDRHRGAAA